MKLIKIASAFSLFLCIAIVSLAVHAQIDPVAHWKLDETAGIVAGDASANGNAGTLVGGPVWTPGQLGGALSFDGRNDYVVTTSPMFDPSATDFSVSLWFKTNGSDHGSHFIAQSDGVGTGRVWIGVHPVTGVYSYLGQTRTETQFIPTLGQWYHAVLSKSGTTIKLYIDGELKVTNNDVMVESATGVMRMGSNKTSTDVYLNGAMDDVRIYDYALSPSAVIALHHAAVSTSLVAHWTFDETSGIIAGDASTHGNTGTLVGGPVWTPGQFGGALSLDGSNDYVVTTSPMFDPSATDFSVSLWFKTNGRDHDMHFVSQADGAGIGRAWLGNDPARGVYSYLGQTRTDTRFIPTPGQWYLAVLTKSGTTIKLYVDGELKATNNNVMVEAATGILYIGSNKTGTAGNLSGTMDDVRVYDQTLSPSNVLALYNATASTSLVSHWTFDETSGIIAGDASIHGNTGTLVGGPIWMQGQFGGALSFDGSNDYVVTANSMFDPNATDFSVSLWFKTNDRDYDTHFIAQADGTGIGRAWLGNDPARGVYSYLGQTRTDTQFIPTLGQWYLAVLTKTGTTVKLYIDGELKATNNNVMVEAATGILYIGSNKTGTAGNFSGAMDDVRVYDKVLSTNEILGLHQTLSVWTRWETSLASSVSYANPYSDVTVSVTYTGANGESFTGNAFWDGGNIFRLRFMFPTPGIWNWNTASSDINNAGLNNRSGTVTVAEYSGNNILRARGYPKVSSNNRYLIYDDGAPFLWLGDTAWSALIAATQAEWESYVQLRKAQKFNVIQVHSGDGWVNLGVDSNGNPPFTGSGPTLAWNPVYWQGVEEKVQFANDRGLMVYFAAVRQPGPGFPDNDSEEVERFARNLVARMMGDFVIYSPVVDDVWTALADVSGRELAASTSMHLITAHPRFFLSPAEMFHNRNYVDFTGLQSGNGWTYDPYIREQRKPFVAETASQSAVEWTLALYNRTPAKPVINMEVVYDSERLQAGNTEYYLSQYPGRMPRSTAYLSMLSGSAGITYGAGGVWNWGVPLGNATSGWTLNEALSQSSSVHMQYLFELFSGLEWWNLVPSHQLIRNQSPDWLKKMVVAKTNDGDLGVAYLPDNENIVLDMSVFSGSMQMKWFNPRTNSSVTVPSLVANSGAQEFNKPTGWEDAVLVLSR